MDTGLEVVDIELHREGRGNMLRVYMDRLGGGGVDLDTLARVSRELSAVLDVDDPIPGRYTLEVSSPGVNRRLRVPDHFRRYLGKRVRVRSAEPIDGRRAFLGTLQDVGSDAIRIDVDGQAFTIPFRSIAQANYEHDFDSSPEEARRHDAART